MHRVLPVALVITMLVVIGSASIEAQPSAIIGATISNGYVAPTSKVGITDGVPVPGLVEAWAASRYARFTSIGTKLKHYGVYWEWFEPSSSPASSLDPNLACPSTSVRVPSTEQERIAKGFHRFRCFDIAYIARYDHALLMDHQAGIESALVLYGTPLQYRYPGCQAPDGVTNWACVPRDDAMNEFEDFVNFLTSRYNGALGGRTARHYVVWNEVQSGYWFNYAPVVPWAAAPSPQQIDLVLEKYKAMLLRVHAAISRHVQPAMMYVSLDGVVGHINGGAAAYHIGTQTILDGLWAKLGTSIDWAIAIHPYLAPAVDTGGTFINYHALSALVSYQSQQLAARGLNDPLRRPQATLFASEQGWTADEAGGHVGRAVYMCQAHEISMRLPSLVGSTHSQFQFGDHGLIPIEAGVDLAALESPPSPEWLAYQSTSPSNWGRNNSHGCCTAAGLGCVGSIKGNIDGVFNINGVPTLSGWACSESVSDSIAVHLYALGPAGTGVYLTAAVANLASEKEVAGACRAPGAAYRYTIPLTPWLAYHNVPLYVHGISPFGAPNALLSGSGSHRIP